MLAGSKATRVPWVGDMPGSLPAIVGLGAEAVEDDVGAGVGERMGDAEADAGGRAGDDGGLAFELHDVLVGRWRWHVKRAVRAQVYPLDGMKRIRRGSSSGPRTGSMVAIGCADV